MHENESISARVCMYVCDLVHMFVCVWYMCLCVHACGGVRVCAHCVGAVSVGSGAVARCGALLPMLVGPLALAPSCSAL